MTRLGPKSTRTVSLEVNVWLDLRLLATIRGCKIDDVINEACKLHCQENTGPELAKWRQKEGADIQKTLDNQDAAYTPLQDEGDF